MPTVLRARPVFVRIYRANMLLWLCMCVCALNVACAAPQSPPVLLQVAAGSYLPPASSSTVGDCPAHATTTSVVYVSSTFTRTVTASRPPADAVVTLTRTVPARHFTTKQVTSVRVQTSTQVLTLVHNTTRTLTPPAVTELVEKHSVVHVVRNEPVLLVLTTTRLLVSTNHVQKFVTSTVTSTSTRPVTTVHVRTVTVTSTSRPAHISRFITRTITVVETAPAVTSTAVTTATNTEVETIRKTVHLPAEVVYVTSTHTSLATRRVTNSVVVTHYSTYSTTHYLSKTTTLVRPTTLYLTSTSVSYTTISQPLYQTVFSKRTSYFDQTVYTTFSSTLRLPDRTESPQFVTTTITETAPVITSNILLTSTRLQVRYTTSVRSSTVTRYFTSLKTVRQPCGGGYHYPEPRVPFHF